MSLECRAYVSFNEMPCYIRFNKLLATKGNRNERLSIKKRSSSVSRHRLFLLLKRDILWHTHIDMSCTERKNSGNMKIIG